MYLLPHLTALGRYWVSSLEITFPLEFWGISLLIIFQRYWFLISFICSTNKKLLGTSLCFWCLKFYHVAFSIFFFFFWDTMLWMLWILLMWKLKIFVELFLTSSISSFCNSDFSHVERAKSDPLALFSLTTHNSFVLLCESFSQFYLPTFY